MSAAGAGARTKKPVNIVMYAAALTAAVGLGTAVIFRPAAATNREPDRAARLDPRQGSQLVQVAIAKPAIASERVFTGVIAARVQSNLGFRVPGKVVERLVDVGQQVHAGQPLMRLDPKDLDLALTARENAVAAARAAAVQARDDEVRYRELAAAGAESRQKYEQAKTASDSAAAQLRAAEAQADVARNETGYSLLLADADGTVVETLAEPGQVVAAGQTVVKLAHAGPREAVVNLPEIVRPAIGSPAQVTLYGGGSIPSPAHLRQLSDAADPATRTYEARYVLDGDASRAPLGSTVTVSVATGRTTDAVELPLGALYDDGKSSGVWVVDPASSSVLWRTVQVRRLGEETVVVTGPSGVLGPFVNDEYSDVTFALYALKAPGMAPRLLVRQAEAIRQELLHVPGVKKVNILGERPERIFVEFSYPQLVTLGITAQDIFAALRNQNAVTPAGSIDTKGPQVFVRLDGAYDDLEKIADTPIVAGGRNLKLSDVAKVRRGYEDPPTFLIRNQGEPALALSVVMQEGWNGLDLGKALETEVKTISRGLPLGITLSKITDQAVNITEAVDEFMLKFFVALGVVLVVSLLSLGWRVGIVVAATVPLTLAAVFVIMLDTGRFFDRITLGALILALGLLVDDAIIAIETMVVKMEEGMDRIQAAAYAWSHTAAPMLSGTLVTVVGLMPVGFARSSAGEYAGNIFWIVGFALIASWVVAVAFTPYLGVKLLPQIKPVQGGHDAIYATSSYRRLRRVIAWSVRRKFLVAGAVVAVFLIAAGGMSAVKKQFFPTSDRPEVLAEVQMPEGSSIEATANAVAKVEAWLKQQPEAKIITSYIGQGAPRFFLAMSPELPDPSFGKIVILTANGEAREALKQRLRQKIAEGLAPEARLRATQLVFGPYSPFPVAFRVTGPDPQILRGIADQVQAIMRANPGMRQVNRDWGERVPTEHFVLDQERLRLIGLSPSEAAQQLQFLLTGVMVTQVREDIRTVDVVARSAGAERLDPARLADFTLTSRDGRMIPLRQIGHIEVRMEDPILRRRDRMPTITVRGDINESLQPPEVSMELQRALQPIMAKLPAGYRIEMAGSIEESAKANVALAAVFPIMVALMVTIIILQVRSFSAAAMVLFTAPLGLIGAVPVLLLFHQAFGFNAILGLIGLAGILMRNTLILIGQIHTNQQQGLDAYHAVVEATVQRTRPVVLTALAAVLAFIPLTRSVFWGSMAYTLIGGTAVGTVLILVFLPALYAIWFRVRPLPARNETPLGASPSIDHRAVGPHRPALRIA